QFRHAQRVLSRIRAGGLGVAAHRPPGKMDVRTPGGFSQRLSGTRSLRRGRTCARRRRPLSGAARLEHQQCRGAHRFVRAADEGCLGDVEVYHIPAAWVRARAVMSNTPPTNPYRSAGRAEVMFVMERLIDLAASTHGFDRIELRRRNLVRADAMPYTNPLGL